MAAPPASADCPRVDKPSLPSRLGTRLHELAEKCEVGRANERDPVLDAAVSGKWEGRFEYDDSGLPGGTLTVDFGAHDGVLAGTAVETEGGRTMEANLTGDVYASRQVVWMGTYFAGGDHSVMWTGTLDASGRRIAGHWRLDRGTGTFVLERK